MNQFNLNGTPRANPFASTKPTKPTSTVGAFLHYFYDTHPFLLPRPRLIQLLKERRVPLLELAIQYIGSCFLPNAPTDMYKEALNRTLANQNIPKDGYTVQALVLYAIALHATNDLPRSAQVFITAMGMALEIGLNRAQYSMIHGNGDPVLEECWRRTWWGMFTANGMFAAVNPRIPFRLKDIATDVPLPCENDEYFSGVSKLENSRLSSNFLHSSLCNLASHVLDFVRSLHHTCQFTDWPSKFLLHEHSKILKTLPSPPKRSSSRHLLISLTQSGPMEKYLKCHDWIAPSSTRP
jgi:hypothetical protein